MSHLRTALVACVLSAAILGLTGCSSQTEPANKLIDQMNVLNGKSNTLETQIAGLIDDIGKVDPTSKDVTKATPLLAQAQAKLDQEKINAQAVGSLADQISALDVESELKTYAGQQKEIATVDGQDLSITAELLGTFRELYDPKKASKFSQAELDALTNKANDLIASGGTLRSKIAEKQGASDQYFRDNLQ